MSISRGEQFSIHIVTRLNAFVMKSIKKGGIVDIAMPRGACMISWNRPLRVYSLAKYAAIARGDAEIFMKFAKAGYKEKIWDHAAGVLIVQEAGGVVTDAAEKPLDFSQGRLLTGLDRGIIACSGKILQEKLLKAVDASWNSSTL